jgi:hypothetical protein
LISSALSHLLSLTFLSFINLNIGTAFFSLLSIFEAYTLSLLNNHYHAFHQVATRPLLPCYCYKNILLSTIRSVQAILTVFINPLFLNTPNRFDLTWYGTSFTANSDIWYSAPATIDTQRIDIERFGGYVTPGTKPADIKNADIVYICAHGGGMHIGQPLQYLNEYNGGLR